VLDHQQRGATPLAPDSDALQGAKDDEQYGGEEPHELESRQDAHQKGGKTHEQEGKNEYGLPAESVAVVSEDGAPQGRKKKPTPKVAKAARVAKSLFSSGKNSWVNTVLAANP